MLEAASIAYPLLMAVAIGVYKLGSDQTWGLFEWLRLGLLAVLTGLLVALHVKLGMMGFIDDLAGLVSAFASGLGIGMLLCVYFWRTWMSPRRTLTPEAAPTA